jgi:thymidylate synthase (FAD)
MSQIKVELQEFMGTDRSIAEAAWTSSLTYQGKEKRTEEDVSRVIKLLAEQKHSTPFESVVMRFWIKMPIQTDRQHMTHRIGSHSGLSGRYRTMPSDYLSVPDDVRSIASVVNSSIVEQYETLCSHTNNFYSDALKQLKLAEQASIITNAEYKRAREFFRGVLPQNNMTERVTIFNLRSFVNYQKLRNSPHAQPEIQKVARLMLEEVKNKNVAPLAISWLEQNNWEL